MARARRNGSAPRANSGATPVSASSILDPRISAATNDAATVNFVRHYEVVIDGERTESQSNATMELRRSGTSWIIERIRFDSTALRRDREHFERIDRCEDLR